MKLAQATADAPPQQESPCELYGLYDHIALASDIMDECEHDGVDECQFMLWQVWENMERIMCEARAAALRVAS